MWHHIIVYIDANGTDCVALFTIGVMASQYLINNFFIKGIYYFAEKFKFLRPENKNKWDKHFLIVVSSVHFFILLLACFISIVDMTSGYKNVSGVGKAAYISIISLTIGYAGKQIFQFKRIDNPDYYPGIIYYVVMVLAGIFLIYFFIMGINELLGKWK